MAGVRVGVEAVMTEDLHDDEAVFVMAAILVQTLAARKGKRQGVSVRVWYGLHCCIWFQESKSISASFKSLFSVKRDKGLASSKAVSFSTSSDSIPSTSFSWARLNQSQGAQRQGIQNQGGQNLSSHPFITLPSFIRPSVRPSLDYLVILPP